jgi:DNA segregation ATPase FtsK/SpoIIIE-like protein
MTYRRREHMALPRIIILIDHIVSYLESSSAEAKNDLYRLLQYGAQAGIHLVLAADRPDSLLLDSTLKASLTMRLIGQLSDPIVARRVAGIPLEQATRLYGEGDFLAVAGDDVTYFQAAYVSDYELHHQLTEMNQSARPILLAQPYSSRPRIKDKPAKTSPSSRMFTMHDGSIELDTNPPVSGEDPSERLPF